MKTITNKIRLAILMILLASGAQYAVAATSAQANINWNSLNVQYFDLSGGTNAPLLTWTYGLGTADTSAFTANTSDFQQDSQFAEDLVTTLSINSLTTQAQSSALRSSSNLQANAATKMGTGSKTDTNEAHASAYNYAEFELIGKGSALITLEWTATSAIGTAGNWDDYAYAAAFINGNFDDNNGNTGSSTSSNAYYTSQDGVFNFNGTFRMEIFGDGINTVSGAINAEAVSAAYSKVSQVPVPNAVWLFGSGLLGMLRVSIRRQFLK